MNYYFRFSAFEVNLLNQIR